MTVRLEELLAAADVDALEVAAAEAASTLLHVGAGHTVWPPRVMAERGKAGQEAVQALAVLARANAERDRLLIDMGEKLRKVQGWYDANGHDSGEVAALLARLDRLGNQAGENA